MGGGFNKDGSGGLGINPKNLIPIAFIAAGIVIGILISVVVMWGILFG